MTDTKTPEERSRNMSRIRSGDTKPEMFVRKALFALGYRYRLHRKDLPGKPDIVMPGRRIAIFVHGCFWHQHSGCRKANIPASHREYWVPKLEANVKRDSSARTVLRCSGWRVLWIWECALQTKEKREELPAMLREWIESNAGEGEIPVARG
mgnify:CR=1 FL=1